VFLALRLALIRDLGRHDVSLPLVMDDALVNFDDGRARLAARVLVEFIAEQAADRQLLVLTCHEHVARIFHEAGAHVRSFTDPLPVWGRRPADPPAAPRIVVRPAPTAVVNEPPAVPEPLEEEVPAAPEPAGDLWPAEAFFFGGSATPAAAEPRRSASRTRRRPRR
jgi:hypothetical protein